MTALKELAAALASGGADTPGPEWRTAQQYAVECGCEGSNARRLLMLGMRAGKVERKDFRVPSGNGVRPIPHYRVLL